ncbi:dethiobiotin synthetase [Nocardioides albertanoniae]|uniref:ATP-dependent dethiobiotin synthetase BioD n=1 Tax=Nocardioides albertanoniae TaxID=1175486 RepID=A0A543A5C3_9ACTN|nr:dethiobiotin synthase [Nocardioides albertanoniae]TQL67754.1 dethiobiotin synthetase [Nocardioides albertanoniae]
MTGRVLIVTGTSTGLGKTVATATLAARARDAGESVAVVKPVQTGTADGDSDAAEIHRRTGIEVHELTTLEEPLAPDTAARRAGVEIPRVAAYAPRVSALASDNDLVLVEGSGGLLVRLDTHGGTLLDLADALRAARTPTSFVIVTSAGLGTLNHTELTVAALRARGYEPDGLIIGSWPSDPGLAERCNRDDLPRVTGVPLLSAIPKGIDNHSQQV